MTFMEGSTFTTPKWGQVRILEVDLDKHLATISKANGERSIIDMDTFQEVHDVANYMLQKEEEIKRKEERQQERAQKVTDRAERREEREERKNIIRSRFAEKENFVLAGFIAASGKITGQIPEAQIDKFEREYQEVKGKPPVPGSYSIEKGSKWHKQLRIHIPKSKVDAYMMEIMVKMGLDPKVSSSNYDINDSFYVMKLFEIGFDIGKASASDVDGIEEYIKNNYGEESAAAFLQGYTY